MRRWSRLHVSCVTAAAATLALAVVAQAEPAAADVVLFPSSQTIRADGPLPAGGATAITLHSAAGEREGAWLVVRDAKDVGVAVRPDANSPVAFSLAWGHFVRVGSTSLADALVPWDGAARPVEASRQPIYVRAVIPPGTPAGTYRAVIAVTTADRARTVEVAVRVYPIDLSGSGAGRKLLTSFHVSAPTYLATVARLYGFDSHAERSAAHEQLYRFLAEYSLSPSSWGFGEPRSRAGYTSSPKWWLDSATNMRRAAGHAFGAMRLPISSNRTAAANRIADVDPNAPETWCDYLRSVRRFWDEHGWTARSVPVLYAFDEPDAAGQRLVARQARAAHDCWPGSRVLMTGNPDTSNRYLADGRGGDDVDIWTVLTRRFYGRFTAPAAPRKRERELAASIAKIRPRASIWSYTYSGVAGTPGLGALEPLSNPRMLVLWNALEDVGGLLYGQGTTTYVGNPLETLTRNGEFVLFYPGPNGPIPSARLEQLRDGIEDWALFDTVRRRSGSGTVRGILGRAGLFTTTRSRTRLACTMGCELKGTTKYSWPLWSHDATTPGRIERARQQALRAAR